MLSLLEIFRQKQRIFFPVSFPSHPVPMSRKSLTAARAIDIEKKSAKIMCVTRSRALSFLTPMFRRAKRHRNESFSDDLQEFEKLSDLGSERYEKAPLLTFF